MKTLTALRDFFTIELPHDLNSFVVGKVNPRKRAIRWSSVGVVFGFVILFFYAYSLITINI